VEHQARLVLQSVNQGRRLRDNVEKLSLSGNPPFGGLVTAEHPENPVDMDAGLTFTVVGPVQSEIDALEEEWDKHLKKAQAKKDGKTPEAIAAAYLDKSAYNLSSIGVMAELEGIQMLLTGDARGDHVLQGLEAKGFLQLGAKMKVDVLKLPHHGSIRNVDRNFFERIVADHYVISADGKHDNPDRETLELLTEVRGDDEYTIYLTNRVPHAVAFFDVDQPKRRYRVVYREERQPSVKVELGDALPD
jgi:CRISPR/Cas system-associated exonuclease Cas4 (RecB family)